MFTMAEQMVKLDLGRMMGGLGDGCAKGADAQEACGHSQLAVGHDQRV